MEELAKHNFSFTILNVLYFNRIKIRRGTRFLLVFKLELSMQVVLILCSDPQIIFKFNNHVETHLKSSIKIEIIVFYSHWESNLSHFVNVLRHNFLIRK